MNSLKLKYAESLKKSNTDEKIYLSKRLFSTYNRICIKLLNKKLTGVHVDLGGGDGSFSKYCRNIGIESYFFDLPEIDLEKDNIPLEDKSVDFITMNAVLEHLQDPSKVFSESFRILKKGGLIFVRTPNWKLCYKDFYNDPTHVKPYTPESLRFLLSCFGFEVIFLEPGLAEKSWIYWKLPNAIKWKVASIIKGGTKSIICVDMKK